MMPRTSPASSLNEMPRRMALRLLRRPKTKPSTDSRPAGRGSASAGSRTRQRQHVGQLAKVPAERRRGLISTALVGKIKIDVSCVLGAGGAFARTSNSSTRMSGARAYACEKC
jgi:hypothetical protein